MTSGDSHNHSCQPEPASSDKLVMSDASTDHKTKLNACFFTLPSGRSTGNFPGYVGRPHQHGEGGGGSQRLYGSVLCSRRTYTQKNKGRPRVSSLLQVLDSAKQLTKSGRQKHAEPIKSSEKRLLEMWICSGSLRFPPSLFPVPVLRRRRCRDGMLARRPCSLPAANLHSSRLLHRLA